MKKLTVRQALVATRRIWAALAKNAEHVKPEWAEDKYQYACPCCEFVCQHSPDERNHQDSMRCSGDGSFPLYKPSLSLCPLSTLWPKGCCSRKSVFMKWCNAGNDETRKIHAATIAAACTRLLEGKKVGK